MVHWFHVSKAKAADGRRKSPVRKLSLNSVLGVWAPVQQRPSEDLYFLGDFKVADFVHLWNCKGRPWLSEMYKRWFNRESQTCQASTWHHQSPSQIAPTQVSLWTQPILVILYRTVFYKYRSSTSALRQPSNQESAIEAPFLDQRPYNLEVRKNRG